MTKSMAQKGLPLWKRPPLNGIHTGIHGNLLRRHLTVDWRKQEEQHTPCWRLQRKLS